MSLIHRGNKAAIELLLAVGSRTRRKDPWLAAMLHLQSSSAPGRLLSQQLQLNRSFGQGRTMNRIVVEHRVREDGVLQLTLPLGAEGAGRDVQVTVELVGPR